MCIGWGPTTIYVKPSSALPSDYCSDGGGSDPTDIICEDAEGSNVISGFDTAQVAWDAANEDGDNTITEQAHVGTIGCTGAGSYAISVYVANTNANEEQCNVEEALGTSKSAMYAQLIVTPDDTSTWENSEELSVINFYQSTNGYNLASVQLKRDGSGNIVFQLRYMKNDYAQVEITGSTVLSDNTWYRVGLEWKQNSSSDGARLWINGTEEVSSDDNSHTTVNESMNKIYLGSRDESSTLETGGADAVTVQIDLVGIDDDTMPTQPAGCP